MRRSQMSVWDSNHMPIYTCVVSNAFVLRPLPGKSNVATKRTDRHIQNARTRAWAQERKKWL